MRNLAFACFLLVSSVSFAAPKYRANPVPKNLRVLSAAPRQVVWDQLSPQERQLAYYLTQAASAGRYILFYQNHRHALAMKAIFEDALTGNNFSVTRQMLGEESFREFLAYAAKFEDMAGPYEGNNRKMLMSEETASKLMRFFAQLSPDAQDEIHRLLSDPDYEVIQFPEDSEGTDLENSGGNMYEKGITGVEVAAALKRGMKSGLNCRIQRFPGVGPDCSAQFLGNPMLDPTVRLALMMAVDNLRRAHSHALTMHQRNEIELFIRYFEKGDVEDFRKASIEWVLDRTSSTVDFMLGFVEVYQDYLNQIGSWESYVQIVDPKTTALSAKLAQSAQYFEDQMPYGKFKKTFPKDYSPPAMMVYYFQEISSARSAGYNLPNFDDIRISVGAKNVIKLDMPGEADSPETRKSWREAFEEFLPPAKVETVLALREKIWRTVVLLHEIIGHGSGTYDPKKYKDAGDPVGALGALGSALEEQRADQTALVFAADPSLASAGLYADQAEADRVRDAMYDWYMADFLRRTSRQGNFTEAHQRGHWLVTHLLLESGAVEWVSRKAGEPMTPENQVLAVKDYNKFFQVSRDLLAELQRIKATRDDAALAKLFGEHAPLAAREEAWVHALVARGRGLSINSGAVEQPWRIDGGFTGALTVFPLGGTTLETIAPYWQNN